MAHTQARSLWIFTKAPVTPRRDSAINWEDSQRASLSFRQETDAARLSTVIVWFQDRASSSTKTETHGHRPLRPLVKLAIHRCAQRLARGHVARCGIELGAEACSLSFCQKAEEVISLVRLKLRFQSPRPPFPSLCASAGARAKRGPFPPSTEAVLL